MEKEKENPEFSIDDRGYNVKAWYLKEPAGDALIEITKNGDMLRRFTFPAYKIFNIAAHFSDIVDSEEEKNVEGYLTASSTGLGGHAPIKKVSP